MLERITNGRTDLVFDYLDAGNPADSTDPNGVSLIKWCAYYGDVSAIRHLLAHGALLESLGDNFDLNGASFHGHWRLVQFLLENGADPNKGHEESGESPLHNSLCKANSVKHEFVVEILLQHGAEPNVHAKENAETGAFMRDVRTKGESPLHRAAAFGTERSIDLLLGAGADKEARDMNGDSPLSWASWHLRPGSILAKLSFGDHTIHHTHVESYKGDHGQGISGMDLHLLGKPRFED